MLLNEWHFAVDDRYLGKKKYIQDVVGRRNANSQRKNNIRCAINDDADEDTIRWFHEVKKKNLPFSGQMICKISRKFTSLLENIDFKANNG